MGPKPLRRDTVESKTPRRGAMDPKTLHRDALQPKTSRHDAIESKTPRRVDPFCDEFPITSARDKQRCDQIYNEFELVGGDDEELEDVPWRKPKSNQSKNDSAVNKTPFGKWPDPGGSQAEKQTQPPTATASVQEELLLDENFPNVKPTTVSKSTFGFSGRKPVKLSMEDRNKKPELVVAQQHVYAVDDSPELGSVKANRVLDDDVVIVCEDIFGGATKRSPASKQAPLKLHLSKNKQIPVLGAGATKPIRPCLPPVPAANQMYRPPYAETYPPKHDNRPFGVPAYVPPPVNSVGPPAEYFIGRSPVAPVPPVTRLPLNNFNQPPPSSSNWIPLSKLSLPSPLKAGVAPPLHRPALSNPPITKEVSTPAPAAASKDAVKDEMQEQNRTLLVQKQEYVGRLRVLTDEMAKLKSQRKIISRGLKTPEKDVLQKENKRLQIEVQSKITAVENVIDMLSNMIVRNGGNPKTELEKNTDSQKESTKPKDDKSQKLLPISTKKITRDRYSRSRSSSRHRSRSRSPRDRRRNLASRSRSRSRSRRRSRSRPRSSSRSPHDQRGRRSRSQKRDYEGQHPKSIAARKTSPATLPAQTNPGVAVDARRETYPAVGKREEPTKTSIEYQNKKLKADSSLSQTKIDERTKMTGAETNATSEASRPIRTNYVYYDSETHWCRVCNVFPQTAKEYLTHLHSAEHKTEMTNQNMVDYPWHKVQPEVKKTYPDAPTKRVPIRGLQFFVSATAWYCKLCDVFMGDLHCASVHLKSDQHEQKLSMYASEHPSWEDEWLKNRTSAYEEYSRKICDSQADEFVCAPQSTLDDTPKVSTAPVTLQPSSNAKESRVVNPMNGDSRSNRAQEDELKKRPKERSRSRGRSRERSRGRTRDRNHSRGRYRSRDRDQSRGRDRSGDRDYSRGSADQLDRRKYDKSKYSRQESNSSKESGRSSNDSAASSAFTETNPNDDEFVREWIPPVRSTGKEKELADLRDKLRRTKENERKREESDKRNEGRSRDSKRHADRSPSRESGPDEKCAKVESKAESHPPPVKMQPIVIGKTPRFPFIGKMPQKSYRKSDPHVAPIVSEVQANIDEKFTELEKLCAERVESEPDLCNTVVDMDVNDVEDVPIVMELADEIAVRKKDFDETMKILYPDKAQSVPAKSTDENYLLSLVRSTVLETMKQLPNQNESLDPTAVVSLMETMSKKLLTVSRKAENDDRAATKSNETSRHRIDSTSARKHDSKSKSTVPEIVKTVKNEPASRNKSKSMSVRAKLEEQEKQLQERIDEKRRILEIESIPTPPENNTAMESIALPEPKTETDSSVLPRENNDDMDLLLLGIEEGDSAALQF